MRTSILTLAVFLLMSRCGIAQPKPPPGFEAYPVHEQFLGKPASPKLTERRARMFRTTLREQAAKGVNFAGHYIAVTWGCGSDCWSLAIIDARTGHVYFTPSLLNVGGFGYSGDEIRVQFCSNSRLLIAVGAPNDKGYVGRYYYLWKKNRLRLLRAIEDRAYKG